MSKHVLPLRDRRYLAIVTFTIPLVYASVNSATAAPVDPATLNPYVYLDANLGVDSGGLNTTVTAWQDQSANAFLFQSNHPNAGSNDPTWTTGPNSNLAIEFDGSDIIDSDDALQLFTADDSPLTVFTVMSPASLPGNQQFLVNHAPGAGGESFELGPDSGQVQSPGAWGIHRGSSQATSTGPNILTAGAFAIMTTEVNSVGFSGSNVAFFMDGAHQPNAAIGWHSPGNYHTGSDPLAIGARIDNKGQGFDTLSPNSFFSGQLSELIIFREQLSTSDRQGVEEFLGSKYDIPVTQSVAPPPIEPPTPLEGDVIGDELILRTHTDGDSGAVYIYGTGTFSEPGFASEYGFLGPIAGRYVTPLIFEVVDGSIDDNDAIFILTGVGESIASDGNAVYQKAPFTLLAGSDEVSLNHTFGHFDGEVVADGLGGIDVVSRNQGTVSFGGAADGAWAFSGGGQVPFDLDFAETFATAVETGGSGDFFDPIKVFSRADGNGRTYSAQMSAVTEPSNLCDFDGSEVCDGDDIDMLIADIAAGANTAKFDLTGDGIVETADRNEWLTQAATENGFAESYLLGDANLDGTVNAMDLNALALNWQGSPNAWSSGDFNADGIVNAGDLNDLALNWQQSINPAGAPIPEPSSCTLLTLAGLGVVAAWRRRRTLPPCGRAAFKS